jgi:hypothetical protein
MDGEFGVEMPLSFVGPSTTIEPQAPFLTIIPLSMASLLSGRNVECADHGSIMRYTVVRQIPLKV